MNKNCTVRVRFFGGLCRSGAAAPVDRKVLNGMSGRLLSEEVRNFASPKVDRRSYVRLTPVIVQTSYVTLL